MDQKKLRVLSYATSPTILAAVTFLILSFILSITALQLLISLLFATILPISVIKYFAKRQNTNLDVPERENRIKPYSLAIIIYTVGTFLLFVVHANYIVVGLMAAYAINTTAMVLITLRWKISAHAIGLTGPASFIIYVLGPITAPIYLLIIPIGMIRLKLGIHTIFQVAAF